MSRRDLLFSAQGRIPRSTWWKFNLLLLGIVILGIIGIVLFGPEGSGDVIGLYLTCSFGVFCILMVYPSLMVNIKRYHDRDKAGWPLLGYYLPAFLFVGATLLMFSGMVELSGNILTTAGVILAIAWGWYDITIIVELGLLKGTPDPNKYGPDPLRLP